MIPLKLTEILLHMEGELVQGTVNQIIKHVAIDARDTRKNTLYFARSSKGTKWKSFPFKDSVVIVTENPYPIRKHVSKNITITVVKDLEQAYWNFVNFYRSLVDIPVIGITGTCGKTTTTEMIKHILSQSYQVQGTYDGKNGLSHNLPYLLGIDKSTEAAVFEMGVSHPGCIENSCRYFRPKVGVLLNIGVYHLLGCKTFDNYLKAKAEILQGITPDGTLIVNADDENVALIDVNTFPGRIITFGLGEGCDYRALDLQFSQGGMRFTLELDNHTYPLFVNGHGQHNVYNALAALAALAAVHVTGMDIMEAGRRLKAFKQVRQHLEFKPARLGCTVIDDTWNCTPTSMAAALKVLQERAAERQKVAVLGYFPQLGDNAKGQYDKMAAEVVETGIHRLIVIGEAERIGREAEKLGMDQKCICYCETGEEVYNALHPILNKNVLVLLKFPYKYRLRKLPSFRKLMDWIFEKE